MAHLRRVILITGIPRSGTTPFGSNLELAPGARHLYEPFNPGYGMQGISRHYEVPGANDFSLERFDACVDAIRRVRLQLKRYNNPRESGARRVVKWLIADRARFAYWRCRLDRSLDTVIWKDPNACFAAKAAVDRHQIPVVVTVRPAAAVAASYKRMGWHSSLLQVLENLAQIGISYPELLSDYGKHVENHTIGAAMLWYVIYSTLLEWAETRPLMRLVNLQETIERPIEYYERVFEWLDLPWSAAVAEGLRRRYPEQDRVDSIPSEALPQRAHVRNRAISRVNTYGAQLLTAEEKQIIEEICGDLWGRVKLACLSVDAPSSRDQPAQLAASG